ncbi:MAG: hypothetical protein JXL84_17215 [Deltaproteobacteria bacterium]|nr:hypothetical protein [Deltaproteobacteria bacterium]
MEGEEKEQVRTWLEQGLVDLFLGYRMVESHPLPHVFSAERIEDVEELVTGPARYPLEKLAMLILARDSSVKVGLLARDCNQRALNVLAVWNQVDPDRVRTLQLTCCPSRLKEHGDCSYLNRSQCGPYKQEVGINPNIRTEELDGLPPGERFVRWMYEFQKCVKCYGCRNICPVCFCKECSLEHPDLIGTGVLPPEVPLFHLVRAVHMAGRCVDCGLCEDACPAEIPLRALYRKVQGIVKDQFGYQTGTHRDQSPFSVLGDEVTLEPKPL